MSIKLQVSNFVVSQGWSGNVFASLINSGDENVEYVRLKVTDAVVFSVLRYFISQTSLGGSILNVYTPVDLYNHTDGNLQFPAGTTKTIKFNMTVNAGAPIQDNPLTCSWQYIGY